MIDATMARVLTERAKRKQEHSARYAREKAQRQQALAESRGRQDAESQLAHIYQEITKQATVGSMVAGFRFTKEAKTYGGEYFKGFIEQIKESLKAEGFNVIEVVVRMDYLNFSYRYHELTFKVTW